MKYVLSDLHGSYDSFFSFLHFVHFNDNDTLYIIGDIIDRNSQGIAILQDIMKRNNVICIMGNHESMLLPVFEELCNYASFEDYEQIINEELAISNVGQEDTLRDFCKLSLKEKWEIIYYIKSLPLYLEINVNSQDYILVHGGLPDFQNVMDMDFYTEGDLLFGPHDFDESHFEDTIVIVGHRPTCFIDGAEPHKIFKSNDSIAIDCGLGFGGDLGVLCLDTLEEFYF